MKLKMLLMALAAMALLPVANAAKADDKLELLVPGEISVATEGTYPPFSMRAPNGDLDGLEIRVMKEIARRLGLNYRPVLVKWESVLIGLEADQYDIISDGMDITSERQKKVTFADGWLESGGRIIVHDGSNITKPTDVKGRTVGALVASSWTKLAEGLGGDVKTYKSESDAIQDLANGNIDAVITDSIAGAYDIKTSGLPLKMVEEPISSIQKGFAVKKGKPHLVAAVNKALADMIADGTYAKLTIDLIGVDPAPKDPIRTLAD
ncbi:transporter substrate-binding domain-containing protein [Mesorhizobium shangrilense]|uniref:Transporter substrate-binding domain-containing protein n=1 Tax=Mesorhizobium shangrilense TaxID=460060 RepID=A0ABV2DIF7_9HYPH